MFDQPSAFKDVYYLSKCDVLKWINSLLDSDHKKIEELGSGVAYCFIFEIIYPGSVQLHKVKIDVKHEYEYIQNYKVLQEAFRKTQHKKHIEVQKLCKCKFQDNLEFCQWMYTLFMSKDPQQYTTFGVFKNSSLGQQSFKTRKTDNLGRIKSRKNSKGGRFSRGTSKSKIKPKKRRNKMSVDLKDNIFLKLGGINTFEHSKIYREKSLIKENLSPNSECLNFQENLISPISKIESRGIEGFPTPFEDRNQKKRIEGLEDQLYELENEHKVLIRQLKHAILAENTDSEILKEISNILGINRIESVQPLVLRYPAIEEKSISDIYQFNKTPKIVISKVDTAFPKIHPQENLPPSNSINSPLETESNLGLETDNHSVSELSEVSCYYDDDSDSFDPNQ